MADLTPHIAVSQRLSLLRQFHADSAAEFVDYLRASGATGKIHAA